MSFLTAEHQKRNYLEADIADTTCYFTPLFKNHLKFVIINSI